MTKNEPPLNYWVFSGLAFTAFYMSLAPTLFGLDIGLSGLIHQIIPQFRVPARAGVFVHFAILVLACDIAAQIVKPKWHWLFPLIIVFELPPFLNPMPLAQTVPRYFSRQNISTEQCGTGMYFPYVSNQWGMLEFYQFLQRMSESRCPTFNAISMVDRDQKILQKMALHPQVFNFILKDDPNYRRFVSGFVKCTGLSWIAFDPHVPLTWRKSLCQDLNWKMAEDSLCAAETAVAMPYPYRAECIDQNY